MKRERSRLWMKRRALHFLVIIGILISTIIGFNGFYLQPEEIGYSIGSQKASLSMQFKHLHNNTIFASEQNLSGEKENVPTKTEKQVIPNWLQHSNLASKPPNRSIVPDTFPNKVEQFESTTFLLGIASTQKEVARRQMLRETYLSYYRELHSIDQPDRICSLRDLQKGRVALKQCQIAYFFFLGGNPNGPTELLKPNTSFPMVIPRSEATVDALEPDDVIVLNIKENLEDGKSQTFFKYASMVVQEFPFDYVGKIDSDTLLFVPAFLDFVERKAPPRPHNYLVYGGNPHDKHACDETVVDSHPCPMELIGDVYMGGAFYWMSPDLAEFISSDAVPRSEITIRHEDVDIGNFAFSHPEANSIQLVNVTGEKIMIHRNVDGNWMYRNRAIFLRGTLWAHSLDDGYYPGPFFKDPRNFRKVWRQFQAFWLSNSTLVTGDIFELYDLPDASDKELVRTNDYIFSKQDFDSSPIVFESHKLIFFTVAGVGDLAWRRLFRRVLGYEDWRKKSQQFKGLRYLYDYSPDRATELMTSPEYTRAIFVRDPKLRSLSSFLKYVERDNASSFRWMCCRGMDRCTQNSRKFSGFLHSILDCDEPFWRPQSMKMEPRYLKYLNFVGHYATIRQDAEQLLRQLGWWEEFGKHGWGENSNGAIFSDTPFLSNETVHKYITHDVERIAQKLYKADYDAKNIFNFSRKLKIEV